MEDHLKLAIDAALKAGETILEIYSKPFKVDIKADHSPVTEADRKAGEIITTILERTGIPVLSEEGEQIPYEERKDRKQLWIVDPLDGTKEFVKKNGEFTINIALIENNSPVLGVIYSPVKNILYYGMNGSGSFRMIPGSDVIKLPLDNPGRKFTVVSSRSHSNPQTLEYLEKIRSEKGEIVVITGGSSVKFCLVAEGSADIYPRFGPTMEWDTAAGQAIVEAVGKGVYDVSTMRSLLYNKANLQNNNFIVK